MSPKSGTLFGVLRILLLSVLCFGAAKSGSVCAQQSSLIDPNETQKKLNDIQERRSQSKPQDFSEPQLARPASPGAGDPLFVLKDVLIEGAMVFDADLFWPIWTPFIGREVSEADLMAIAEGISNYYQNNGYSLSRAVLPPQDVKKGTVLVKVIEGYIGEIGYEPQSRMVDGLTRLTTPLLHEAPLTLATLERQLLLLNDLPGFTLRDTTLEEIGELTGRFRLTLHLESWRHWTELGLDNRGDEDVGPIQGYVTHSINSAFVGGDAVVANISTNPDGSDELRFGGLSYELPIGSSGVRAGISASHTKLRPGGVRRRLGSEITTNSYQLTAAIVPLRTRRSSLTLRSSFGWLDASEGTHLVNVYEDRIVTGGISAHYQLHESKSSTFLNIGLRKGLDIFGASDAGNIGLSRFDGSGEFIKLHGTLNRYQKLSERVSMRVSAEGQISSEPLLSSEEYYLGGSRFGRAYDSGEYSGDIGFAAVAELRYDVPVENRIIKALQLYAFTDFGMVWDKGIDTAQDSLASAGGGVRLNLPYGFRAEAELAAPLTHKPDYNSDAYPRLFFLLSQSFKRCEDGFRQSCAPPAE